MTLTWGVGRLLIVSHTQQPTTNNGAPNEGGVCVFAQVAQSFQDATEYSLFLLFVTTGRGQATADRQPSLYTSA